MKINMDLINEKKLAHDEIIKAVKIYHEACVQFMKNLTNVSTVKDIINQGYSYENNQE